MWDQFTERARRVMDLAWASARSMRHDFIGTEHILLGIIEEGNGVAADVLRQLRVDLAVIEMETTQRITVGTTSITGDGQRPFSSQAKKALDLTIYEAGRLGHDYVGTEHVLLGLVSEGEGIAAQVLTTNGVRAKAVRKAIVGLLAGPTSRWPVLFVVLLCAAVVVLVLLLSVGG